MFDDFFFLQVIILSFLKYFVEFIYYEQKKNLNICQLLNYFVFKGSVLEWTLKI